MTVADNFGTKSNGYFDSVRSNFVNGKSSIPSFINYNSDVEVSLQLIQVSETFFDTIPDFTTNQKSISESEFVKGATFEYYLSIHTDNVSSNTVEVGLALTDTIADSRLCYQTINSDGHKDIRFILRVVSVTDPTNTQFLWSGSISGGVQTPITVDVTTPDRSTIKKFSPRLYVTNTNTDEINLTINNFYFRRIC